MKFIEENWFKIIIAIAVLIIAISIGYYFLSEPPQENSSRLQSNETQTSAVTPQRQQIKDFIKNLPTGDIDSQKCNELVDAKNTDLTYNQSRANNMYDLAKNTEPAGPAFFDLVDSKYLYSHKLCLAEIHTNTYPSPSTMMDDFQIIDLGSNYTPAERIVISSDVVGSNANPKYSYYLNNQEQKNPITISDIWSEIQKIK